MSNVRKASKPLKIDSTNISLEDLQKSQDTEQKDPNKQARVTIISSPNSYLDDATEREGKKPQQSDLHLRKTEMVDSLTNDKKNLARLNKQLKKAENQLKTVLKSIPEKTENLEKLLLRVKQELESIAFLFNDNSAKQTLEDISFLDSVEINADNLSTATNYALDCIKTTRKSIKDIKKSNLNLKKVLSNFFSSVWKNFLQILSSKEKAPIQDKYSAYTSFYDSIKLEDDETSEIGDITSFYDSIKLEDDETSEIEDINSDADIATTALVESETQTNSNDNIDRFLHYIEKSLTGHMQEMIGTNKINLRDMNEATQYEILEKIILTGNKNNSLKYVIDKGINLKSRGTDGNNILMFAIRHNMVAVVEKLLKTEAKEELIYEIGGPNHSALHLTAAVGNIEIMKMLIAGGAAINLLSDAGQSPLTEAISNCQFDMAKFLLESGADAFAAEADALSAYDLAKSYRDEIDIQEVKTHLEEIVQIIEK